MKMATSSIDSALVNLVDEADDELATNQTAFDSTGMDGYSMETDTDQLLEEEPENQTKESPLTFAFYTKLFDVDTEEITDRLKWSLLPRPDFTSSFAKKKIRAKPDFYGPFWICVTLVFSVAIAGNVASYFQYQFTKTVGSHWHYDFHKVTLSAGIVFLYSVLMPSGVFAALWSNAPKDSTTKPSLTELVCIFGYSLAPLVPISILWLIQISMVQWALVFVSFLLSGGLLVLTLMPIIEEFVASKSKAYTIIAAILALHLILAAGFMLCFFHVPAGNVEVAMSSTTSKAIDGKGVSTASKIEVIKNDEAKNNANESKRDLKPTTAKSNLMPKKSDTNNTIIKEEEKEKNLNLS